MKNDSGWVSRALPWVILVFASAGLIFVGFLATKMRLSGDDYCLDSVLLQEGLWGMVVRSYLEVAMYNGNRYSQIFFSGLAGLSPIWGNGYLVIGSLVAWIVALVLLLRWGFDRLGLDLKWIEILMISCGYASLLIWSTPRLDQSVIWRSAMTAYFMPIVGGTWLFYCIAYSGKSKPQKWWHYGLILLAAILSAGFSETGAALLGGSLGLVLLVVLIRARRNQPVKAYILPVATAMLGVVIGVALMYFSPVTMLRRAEMPELMSVNELLTLLGVNLKVYLWHAIMRRTLYVILPVLFGLGLGLTYFVLWRHACNFKYANLSWWHWSLLIVLLPVAMVFLIACVMLPATYVQVSYPPERSLILAQSVMTLGGIVGGVLAVLWVDSIFKFRVQHSWVQLVLSAVGVILLLSVIVSPVLLIQQNAGKVPFYSRWSQFWDERHQVLLQAGRTNQDVVHVIQLDHVISDVGELGPDPDYWYNNCAEMYYSVKTIYADLPGW